MTAVYGLLRVSACLFQHLAHLASHVAGKAFLLLLQDVGGLEEDFGAARGGRQAPGAEGPLRGLHGQVYLVGSGALEDAHQVAGIGRIAVFAGFAAGGGNPLAVNKVQIGFGCSSCAGHEGCLSQGTDFVARAPFPAKPEQAARRLLQATAYRSRAYGVVASTEG